MEAGLPRGIWIPVLVPAEAGEPAFHLLEENLAMASGAEPAGFVVLGAWSEPAALGPSGRRRLYERTLAASRRPVVLDLRQLAPEEALDLLRLAPPAGLLSAEPPPAALLGGRELPWARVLPGLPPAGEAEAGGAPVWVEGLAALPPPGPGAPPWPPGVVSVAAAVAPWHAADLWRALAGGGGDSAAGRLLRALATLERRLGRNVATAKLAMELEGYFGGPALDGGEEAGADERWSMYTLLLELGLLRGG
ncbi:MAG: hypothetical protein K6U79_07540 [Firmicutes bacterium]|nr:hypothetical protein [Bacillota bacterium]